MIRTHTILMLALSVSVVSPAFGQYCGVEGGAGSYLNARYGFEVDYAGGWHRLRVGPREDEFQWVCRDTLVVQGTILGIEYVDFSGERTHLDSLWRAVTHKATLFCGADGVDGGSYCEGPEQVERTVSATGLPVLRFYQTFVYEDYAAETAERSLLGPYFAVDISQGGETRALLLTSEAHRGASEKYAEFAAGLVDRVRSVNSPFLRKRRPTEVPLRR